MSNTDAQRRPVFIDRRNNRLFADPLIGNGAWPEVPITPGMIGTLPAETIVGRRDSSGNASALSADEAIAVLNTATTARVNSSRVQSSSTTQAGVVQLNDAVNSTSTTTAATANAVKTANDAASSAATAAASAATAATNAQNTANAAMPQSGGTFTGEVTFQNDASLTFLNDGCLAGLRNRIINGGCRISQRLPPGTAIIVGAGFSTTEHRVLDRWFFINSTDASVTCNQSGEVPLGQGFSNSIQLSIAGGDPTVDPSNRLVIGQKIEGVNVQDLAYGTVSAKECTLSFWVRSQVPGQYAVAIKNGARNRSYIATYQITNQNVWQKVFVTIPGNTSGVWATDNTTGLEVVWSLGAGATFQGSPFIWQAGDLENVSGNTYWLASNSASFFLTGVQLETGPIATPFERRPMSVEMALCQRYYWKSYNAGVFPGSATTAGQIAAAANNNGSWRATVPFKTSMRTTPNTITVLSPVSNTSGVYYDDTGAVNRTVTIVSSGEDNVTLGGTASAQATVRFHVVADAEL